MRCAVSECCRMQLNDTDVSVIGAPPITDSCQALCTYSASLSLPVMGGCAHTEAHCRSQMHFYRAGHVGNRLCFDSTKMRHLRQTESRRPMPHRRHWWGGCAGASRHADHGDMPQGEGCVCGGEDSEGPCMLCAFPMLTVDRLHHSGCRWVAGRGRPCNCDGG